jgi:hypothetical protein
MAALQCLQVKDGPSPGVTPRGVFGSRLALAQVWARCGWSIPPACGARRNLAIRQRVAAIGRRVHPLGQGAAGVRAQLTRFPVEHPVVRPHASLRPQLLVPAVSNGRASAKRWRPGTPALAAGLTDHVWTLREVLWCRVPPWPQPHAREKVGQEEGRAKERDGSV